MAEWEDPELISSYGYIKATTTYRATHFENDLKTSRTGLPQLKIKKKATLRRVGGVSNMLGNSTARTANQKWEEYPW